jgi:hypothetical protein
MTTLNDYYVYSHIRNDNNQPFYIGKGRDKRCRSKQGRSKTWHDIVNAFGYRIEILDKDLSEQKALNFERLSIALCGKFFKLTNIATGGHGNSGWKHTNQTKEKQRLGLIKSYTPELKETRRKWMVENQPTKRIEVREKMKKPKTSNLGADHFRSIKVKFNNVVYLTITEMLKTNNIGYSTYKYWKRHNKLNEHGIELLWD